MSCTRIDSSSVAQSLAAVNSLILENWALIPTGKRGSVNRGGFTFRLPPRRGVAGLDERLTRPEEVLGKVRSSNAVRFALGFEIEEDLAALEEMATELPEGGCYSRTQSGRSSTMRYISPVPDRGMIGHAEFESVINHARSAFVLGIEAERLTAACVMAVAGCFTPLREISTSLEVLNEAHAVRHTPLRENHEVFVDLHSLHAPVSKSIEFAVPRVIWDACQLCVEQRGGLPDERSVNAVIQRWEPEVTLSRLVSYLAYTGPDYWGYSPAIPQLSFWGIGRNPGVFAAYVRLDERMLATLSPYYEFLAGDSGCLEKVVSTSRVAYGCPHVPLMSEIRAFYCAWNDYHSAFPVGCCPDACVAFHNSYVAGLHLFGLIYTGGCRNYPAAPPKVLLLDDGFLVHREKTLDSVCSFPSWAKTMTIRFASIRAKTVECLVKAGFAVEEDSGQAYGMLELRKDKAVVSEVRASSIASALEDCPRLERWGAFHPNAFRALGMTELYCSGRYHTHTIETFFGRAGQASQPLDPGRIEDPTLRAARESIGNYLMELLGAAK